MAEMMHLLILMSTVLATSGAPLLKKDADYIAGLIEMFTSSKGICSLHRQGNSLVSRWPKAGNVCVIPRIWYPCSLHVIL